MCTYLCLYVQLLKVIMAQALQCSPVSRFSVSMHHDKHSQCDAPEFSFGHTFWSTTTWKVFPFHDDRALKIHADHGKETMIVSIAHGMRSALVCSERYHVSICMVMLFRAPLSGVLYMHSRVHMCSALSFVLYIQMLFCGALPCVYIYIIA